MNNDVYKSVTYIRRMFKRIIKIVPCIEIRHKTVTYEAIPLWLHNEDALSFLCALIYKATQKYQGVGIYLTEDFVKKFPLRRNSSNDVKWVHEHHKRMLSFKLDVEDVPKYSNKGLEGTYLDRDLSTRTALELPLDDPYDINKYFQPDENGDVFIVSDTENMTIVEINSLDDLEYIIAQATAILDTVKEEKEDDDEED